MPGERFLELSEFARKRGLFVELIAEKQRLAWVGVTSDEHQALITPVKIVDSDLEEAAERALRRLRPRT